ncbi:hypothetical protein NHF39_05645 [Pseudomonas proteolytica]|nr:hypothetical protein NHF39_05645 [Pseudomonas proteolytica]
MSGPIALSDEVLGNDTLHTLFTANANALVELATRQSVSNVQKRWASYRQAAWQIFSAVLPFFGRTLGIAAWIWQIMDDLQAIEQGQESGDPQASWAAEADLLLNLGMALILHVALRHPPGQVEPLKRLPTTPAVPVDNPVETPRKIEVIQKPNLTETELHAQHQSPLYTSGALNSLPTRLEATLDSFKVSRPTGLQAQNKTPGPHLHLYPLGKSGMPKWPSAGSKSASTAMTMCLSSTPLHPRAPGHCCSPTWLVSGLSIPACACAGAASETADALPRPTNLRASATFRTNSTALTPPKISGNRKSTPPTPRSAPAQGPPPASAARPSSTRQTRAGRSTKCRSVNCDP